MNIEEMLTFEKCARLLTPVSSALQYDILRESADSKEFEPVWAI